MGVERGSFMRLQVLGFDDERRHDRRPLLEHAVAHLELARTDTPVGSVIAADAMGATSDPRVWLAGNIANPMATVTVAMAAGSTAGAAVNASLVMAETAAAVGALDQR